MVPMVWGTLRIWSLTYFVNSKDIYCLFLLHVWSMSYLKRSLLLVFLARLDHSYNLLLSLIFRKFWPLKSRENMFYEILMRLKSFLGWRFKRESPIYRKCPPGRKQQAATLLFRVVDTTQWWETVTGTISVVGIRLGRWKWNGNHNFRL